MHVPDRLDLAIAHKAAELAELYSRIDFVEIELGALRFAATIRLPTVAAAPTERDPKTELICPQPPPLAVDQTSCGGVEGHAVKPLLAGSVQNVDGEPSSPRNDLTARTDKAAVEFREPEVVRPPADSLSTFQRKGAGIEPGPQEAIPAIAARRPLPIRDPIQAHSGEPPTVRLCLHCGGPINEKSAHKKNVKYCSVYCNDLASRQRQREQLEATGRPKFPPCLAGQEDRIRSRYDAAAGLLRPSWRECASFFGVSEASLRTAVKALGLMSGSPVPVEEKPVVVNQAADPKPAQETDVGGIHLKPEKAAQVDDLLIAGLSTRKVMAIAKVSNGTANKRLNKLVEAGKIERRDSGHRSPKTIDKPVAAIPAAPAPVVSTENLTPVPKEAPRPIPAPSKKLPASPFGDVGAKARPAVTGSKKPLRAPADELTIEAVVGAISARGGTMMKTDFDAVAISLEIYSKDKFFNILEYLSRAGRARLSGSGREFKIELIEEA